MQRRMLKEERLEVTKESKTYLTCEGCGRPIRYGLFCESCAKLHEAAKEKRKKERTEEADLDAMLEKLKGDSDLMEASAEPPLGDADNALGMKLYLFKHERDHLLNINDAILVVHGNLHATQGYISFFSDFPEDMEAGKYIFVVIDSDNRIDSVFEYEIVERDSQSDPFWVCADKPVIYLYPEQDTEVNVRLTLNGKLTTTYPLYDDKLGWTVTASPDGILTDKNGRKYSYLFWEGDIAITPDLSRGFCVKGEDTAGFLEESLKQLGLTDTEADAFVMYWLPLMEGNKYNVITFQTTAYEDVASLSVTPKPDTVIRVNMLWYPTNTYVDMEPQDLAAVNPSERKGFTVVEWGGEKYRKPVFQK